MFESSIFWHIACSLGLGVGSGRLGGVIGKQIKLARQKAGLSQVKLAKKARITQNYLSMVELGIKSPTLRIFTRISKGLNLRPSVLLARSEKK